MAVASDCARAAVFAARAATVTCSSSIERDNSVGFDAAESYFNSCLYAAKASVYLPASASAAYVNARYAADAADVWAALRADCLELLPQLN